MKFTELGRLAKYFDMKTKKDIDRNLSIVSGYTTTVKLLGGIPKLVVDYNTRIIRSDNAYEIIQDYY